jgi:3D (Asp-Asp-Asp) domain-containing protein
MLKKSFPVAASVLVPAVMLILCVALWNYSVRTQRLKADLAAKEQHLRLASERLDAAPAEARPDEPDPDEPDLAMKAQSLVYHLEEKDRQIADLKQEIRRTGFAARMVAVTAYNPVKEQCDDDPLVTASNNRVRPGIVAVSQDLFEQGWRFGRQVYIEGHGVFTIDDKMGPRARNRMDVLLFSKRKAKEFGTKSLRVMLLPELPKLAELSAADEIVVSRDR